MAQMDWPWLMKEPGDGVTNLELMVTKQQLSKSEPLAARKKLEGVSFGIKNSMFCELTMYHASL